MTATAPTAEQLALLPDRDDWQVELRRAYADLRMPRALTFERAMERPMLATCIRNIAHARRRQKGHRR